MHDMLQIVDGEPVIAEVRESAAEEEKRGRNYLRHPLLALQRRQIHVVAETAARQALQH